MYPRSKFCIIGIPDHQGVMNVGGRMGAARGPQMFRKVFNRFSSRIPLGNLVQDLGDVPGLTPDVANNHRIAADMIRKAHMDGAISIVVGGGHDHGFSHLLGISEGLQAYKKDLRLGCINIDAHLDLRKPAPLISSGSPFYLAIEAGVLAPRRFVEFGIQPHCNATALWEYADKKKIDVVPFKKLRNGNAALVFSKKLKKLASVCDAIVISLDLDAAAAAFAPGVSAPQAEGFSSSEIIECIEIAAKSKKVVSLGIFELNPEHDIDLRTARLAATSAYHFVQSILGH